MKCERCGHEWEARVEKPVRCPKCISPFWDRKRTRRIGLIGVPSAVSGITKGAIAKQCPGWGGMNGLHQKGCKGK